MRSRRSINSGAPAWVRNGARYDIDFANRRYWGGYIDERLFGGNTGSLMSPSGGIAGNTYYPTRSGVLFKCTNTVNPITDFGLWEFRVSTNYCIQNRDLTNAAWTKTNATTAKTSVGAEGASNSATRLTATASNATVLQSITLASKALVASAWIKRITGTGTLEMTYDNVTWTDITAQLTSSGYNWVQIAPQTLANPVFGLRVGTSGDAFDVDFMQCEDSSSTLGTKATIPIETTTVAVSRSNQVGHWGSGALINNGRRLILDIMSSNKPWTLITHWSGDPSGAGPGIIATDMTSPTAIKGGNGTAIPSTGNQTPNVGNAGLYNWNKTGIRCQGDGADFCLNGGGISLKNTGSANTPNFNTSGTHFNIGSNGSGTTDMPTNGPIARATWWDRALSDGEFIAFTTL